jgi:hypothetical protein
VIADRLVDGRVLPTGRVLNGLWSDDAVLEVAPSDATPGLFPGPGGARFWLFTVRSGEPVDADHGLHRTATVDLGFVVSGILTMELGDGTLVDLDAGDAYVQNGTSHGWHNRGNVDATIALVVLGTA